MPHRLRSALEMRHVRCFAVTALAVIYSLLRLVVRAATAGGCFCQGSWRNPMSSTQPSGIDCKEAQVLITMRNVLQQLRSLGSRFGKIDFQILGVGSVSGSNGYGEGECDYDRQQS